MSTKRSSKDLKYEEDSGEVERDSSKERDGSVESATDSGSEPYLSGARLWSTIAVLCSCMFLTSLEIPIVTTSLVGITEDLQGFNRVSWIISSYLLGYVSVLIISAKMSDIFGRKTLMLLALGVFIIFSAACGAAQTMTQLIAFRAFQGAGGAGCFSLTAVIITEIIPPDRLATYTGNISLVYSLTMLVGPILGGAICATSTWRWIFLLNIPAGVVAGIVAVISIPRNFPYHNTPNHSAPKRLSKESLRRVDVVGAVLLLLATLSLTAALEEAGSVFPWRSAFVITLLTAAGLLWIAFFLVERRLTLQSKATEPVFPWRFAQSRIIVGLFLTSIFEGGTWFVTIFILPQKYQVVYGMSPLQAGYRLLPFTFVAPFGSILVTIIASKAKVPPLYLTLTASCIQIIGFALLATLPTSPDLPIAQYGYEVIAGFGSGINWTLTLLMTPFSVEPRDKAVAMGSTPQFLVMGGAICLAIATAVFNGDVSSNLAGVLDPNQVDQVMHSSEVLATYPPHIQDEVRSIFAHGYNQQMAVLCAFAGAQIPSALLMWQKKQITV